MSNPESKNEDNQNEDQHPVDFMLECLTEIKQLLDQMNKLGQQELLDEQKLQLQQMSYEVFANLLEVEDEAKTLKKIFRKTFNLKDADVRKYMEQNDT